MPEGLLFHDEGITGINLWMQGSGENTYVEKDAILGKVVLRYYKEIQKSLIDLKGIPSEMREKKYLAG